MAGRRAGIRRSGGALRLLERTGVTRGVFGTSKSWFYVGAGLWTLRKVREMGTRQSEVLISEELRPGQRLIIANDRVTIDGPDGPPPTAKAGRGRRGRRAARRAERRGH